MKHLVMFLLIGTQLGAWADTFNVISMTNLWKYRQDGVAPGASWREAGYDDSSWSNGRALLYVETSPLPAPKNTPLSLTNASGQPVITYYFRTTFTLSNVTDVTLILSNVLDDGAVFYVNGAEVLRVGIFVGAVSNSTASSRTVTDAALEGPYFITPTNLMVGSSNVLAVEVHQANATSSDIVFGTAVYATTEALDDLSITPPAATIATGQNVGFEAQAVGPGPISYEWRFSRTAPGLDSVFAGVDLLTAGPGSAMASFFLTPDWVPVASLTPAIQTFDTIIAVRSYGKGKTAVFGHNGFMNTGFDNARFWVNLAAWGDAAGKRSIATTSGHGEGNPTQLRQSMSASGFVASVISAPITSAKLSNIAVLAVVGTGFESSFTTNEIEAVRQFVEAGGALWVAGQAWVWDSYHPGTTVADWALAKLLLPFGAEWSLASVEQSPMESLHPNLYKVIPSQTNAELNLVNVNTNDAGRYTVRARSPYGERQASALLTVLRPAAITVGPVSLTAGPGGTALLSVQATGDELRYQWNFNGVPVDGQTNATFLINSLDAAGVGSYTVTVYNQVSTVTSEPALVALFGLDMVPGLTLVGPVGAAFRIDFSEALEGGTNWHSLTNVLLPAPVYRVTDWEAVGKPSRFYRAVLLP